MSSGTMPDADHYPSRYISAGKATVPDYDIKQRNDLRRNQTKRPKCQAFF